VERFFAMLRLEQRGGLAELPVDVDSLRCSFLFP